MSVCLPTSIGEAIDKLTILDLKLERISDASRKADVQLEHDNLLNNSELNNFIQTHADLYTTMKKANAIIWDMMDVLRDGAIHVSSEEYLKTCRDCIEYNDIRFRIKNRINQASNSKLKEQKSYKTTVFKLAILGLHESHAPMVQSILQKPLNYYKILYDDVQTTDDETDANVILNLNDFSHVMSNDQCLKQCIYDALKVSDALIAKLL